MGESPFVSMIDEAPALSNGILDEKHPTFSIFAQNIAFSRSIDHQERLAWARPEGVQ